MKYIQRYLTFILLLSIFRTQGNAQVVITSKSYALIFPKSGDGFAGNILRIEKDSIVVFTNDYKYIAKKDISKIILHPKKESGKDFIIGSILGIYIMNYWLGTANSQPGAFLWNQPYGSKYSISSGSTSFLEVLGIAALGIAVGGGLGYLFDNGREANSEKIYIFGGPPQMQEETWEKIQDAFEQKATHGKIHLAISGGAISPPVSNAYLSQLTDAGYNLNTFGSGSFDFFSRFNSNSTNLTPYQNLQVPTDFNWLRTITLSYSVTDEIQAGLCYALLGQPSFVYSRQAFAQDSTGSTSSGNAAVGQRLDGKGYYATCGYNKFFGKDEQFELIVTGGLGLANISFDLNGQFDFISSSFNSVQQDNVLLRKTYFSGMISAGFNYYLYDSFSLGLKADYFYVGTSSAREMPFVFLHDQDLNFSTADIGFTIGFHF